MRTSLPSRETVREIGYDRAKYGFDCDTCAVLNSIHEQSADIAMGVDRALESRDQEDKFDIGAGDQGLMFGYACNETPEFMPFPISAAHKLARRLTEVRKNGTMAYLRPDGKTQVTVEYEDDKPVRIDTIVVSSQHDPDVSLEQIRADVIEHVIRPIIDPGRKIIVDTYGGYSRHGGGAFSGKDPTKVDRSASYMARYIAKNIVAAGLADKCEVQLAYAIGVARPVSVLVDTFGTAKIDENKIADYVAENVDLRPAAIIDRFDLRRPIYRQLAAYGHMGREDLMAPWEALDLVPEMQKALL